MKQLYICEKCGQQYDNWDAAYACEEGHIQRWNTNLDEEIAARYTYKPGVRAPQQIIMVDSQDTLDEEAQQWKHDYTLYTYKLVGEVSAAERESILAENAERVAKEERYWAEYRAKREAEKLAKEQESA